MDKRGFTLIELLIVITIIGILAVVATTAYIGTTKKAARSEAYSNLSNLRLLEEQFFAENASYALLGALTGWRPGTSLSFAYAVTNANGIGLPNPVPVPYDGSTAALPNAATPCFIATATGIAGSRVAGDVFTIDCNNNRNF